jgi:hypothetical protein
LQPIELAWAYVKGGVGRQYSIETTFAIVETRLLAEFNKLQKDNESVEGFIRTSTARATELFHEMDEEDFSDDDNEDDNDQPIPGEEDGHQEEQAGQMLDIESVYSTESEEEQEMTEV